TTVDDGSGGAGGTKGSSSTGASTASSHASTSASSTSTTSASTSTTSASGSSSSSTTGGGCTPTCSFGFSCCGGVCVNETNDILNCGTCGNECSGSHPFCNAGPCGDPPCTGVDCSSSELCCGT